MSADDLSLIAAPITFFHSGKTASNRFLKSAMTERLCVWSDDEAEADSRGKPTPAYIALYKQWGNDAIGTIIMGNVPVDRRYPEAQGNAIIDKTQSWDQVEAFKPVVAAAKSGGSIVIFQLTHGGRQTSNTVCEVPISSSDIQTPAMAAGTQMGGMVFNKPRPMTIPEIEDLIDRFAYASKVVYDAGADGVQLHAAHGYLLSQFLSPRVNHRTDRYGGSDVNRSRLLFEIVAAIRARVPDEKFIIAIKINSADFSDGGFSPDESRDTIVGLEKAGLDLIELSGGTYESNGFVHKRESTIKREAFFIEFADRIRPHLHTAKLCVTGGFRSTSAMAAALRAHSTDLVGIARPLTAEPNLCALLIAGKTKEARENLVPASMQTCSSALQIEELAKGRPVRDLDDEKVAEETAKLISVGGGEPSYPSNL